MLPSTLPAQILCLPVCFQGTRPSPAEPGKVEDVCADEGQRITASVSCLPTSLYGKELPLHSLAWALLLPVSISLLLYSSSWDHAPNQPHKSSSVRLNCKWDPDEDSCILIFKNSTIQTSLRSKKSILNHLSSQISMN